MFQVRTKVREKVRKVVRGEGSSSYERSSWTEPPSEPRNNPTSAPVQLCMEEAVASVLVAVLMLVLGTFIILMAMWRRMKYREMHHRERMAMIERGLAPPAEADPSSPLAQLRLHEQHRTVTGRRMLSGGIAIIGFGLGLIVLIGIAGQSPETAMGLGGAITVLGLAFVVIALVQGERPQPPHAFPPPPSSRGAPPKPPGSDS